MRKCWIIFFVLLLALPVAAQSPDDFHGLAQGRRSIRRFTQKPIPRETLKKLVDDARFAPSAHNRQPWEFVVVDDPSIIKEIFRGLSWKGGAIPENERPSAYVVVLGEPRLNPEYKVDCAFATQNLLLSAHAEGLGACPLGSVNRDSLIKLLNIPRNCEIFLVVALGFPNERPIVQKRPLEEILHLNKY